MTKNKELNCRTSATCSWLRATSVLDSRDFQHLIKYVGLNLFLLTRTVDILGSIDLPIWKGCGRHGLVFRTMCSWCWCQLSVSRKSQHRRENVCHYIKSSTQCRLTLLYLTEKLRKKSSKSFCQSTVLMPLNLIKFKVLIQWKFSQLCRYSS